MTDLLSPNPKLERRTSKPAAAPSATLLVSGAMSADDERLAAAGARVGLQYGCDTPDAMADEIERLRADYMMLARHMCPDMPEDELSSQIPEQIIDRSLQRRQAETAAIRSASLKAAADLLDAGFDRGILKKQDHCAHGRFGWEDCELCASAAIRALAATETPKTGGSA